MLRGVADGLRAWCVVQKPGGARRHRRRRYLRHRCQRRPRSTARAQVAKIEAAFEVSPDIIVRNTRSPLTERLAPSFGLALSAFVAAETQDRGVRCDVDRSPGGLDRATGTTRGPQSRSSLRRVSPRLRSSSPKRFHTVLARRVREHHRHAEGDTGQRRRARSGRFTWRGTVGSHRSHLVRAHRRDRWATGRSGAHGAQSGGADRLRLARWRCERSSARPNAGPRVLRRESDDEREGRSRPRPSRLRRYAGG